MSHPDNKIFSVEIPVNNKKEMQEFQKTMDKLHDSMIEYEERIALELGCSEYAASDILYLRSRSRWNEELENEILRLDKLGKHPPVLAGWNGESEEFWSEI